MDNTKLNNGKQRRAGCYKVELEEICVGYGRYKIYCGGKFVGFLNGLQDELVIFRDSFELKSLKLPGELQKLRFELLCVKTFDKGKVKTVLRKAKKDVGKYFTD